MRFFYGFIGFLWGSIAGAGVAVGLYAMAAGVTWMLYAGVKMSTTQAETAVWILLVALAAAAGLLFACMFIGFRRGYRYGKSLKDHVRMRTMILHLLIPVLLTFAISLFPLLLQRLPASA